MLTFTTASHPLLKPCAPHIRLSDHKAMALACRSLNNSAFQNLAYVPVCKHTDLRQV